jgi:hypothetical protein
MSRVGVVREPRGQRTPVPPLWWQRNAMEYQR